jgi:hypothetical protein
MDASDLIKAPQKSLARRGPSTYGATEEGSSSANFRRFTRRSLHVPGRAFTADAACSAEADCPANRRIDLRFVLSAQASDEVRHVLEGIDEALKAAP